MQNLEEDLKSECIEYPQQIKNTIYRDPNVKPVINHNTRPKKARVYSMQEQFQYVLDKTLDYYKDQFNQMPKASQRRIEKLYGYYQEFTWPLSAKDINEIHKTRKIEVFRIMKLLETAKLAFKRKDDMWDIAKLPNTEVLENLILYKQAMTEWENSYYGKHKELQRAKAKQEKSSEWKTSQEQREAIEEEVKQLKSEEPVTAQEISDTLKEKLKETLSEFGKVTDDDETEEDNFIEDIKYKYELMLEMFPHINIKNLQHVFLQLLTRDVEDSMMANNG